jgi:hypothetical protein
MNEALTELPELLTPAETATAIRKTPASLAQDRYLGRGLPFVRVGRKVLYAKGDVLAYLAAGRVDPAVVAL